MDTIVAWTYVAGFSLPLLGIIIVLIRVMGSLIISAGEGVNGPGLMKVKPVPTMLMILAFAFLILLALLLVVFFVYKFAVPGHPLPLVLDIAGIIIFLLYIFCSGSLFFRISGRFGRNATLSGGLVDMVTEKMMGSASSRR